MNRKKNKSLEEANLHFWLPTKERGTGPHIDAESWLNEAAVPFSMLFGVF